VQDDRNAALRECHLTGRHFLTGISL
jgi:hypothetical protein